MRMTGRRARSAGEPRRVPITLVVEGQGRETPQGATDNIGRLPTCFRYHSSSAFVVQACLMHGGVAKHARWKVRAGVAGSNNDCLAGIGLRCWRRYHFKLSGHKEARDGGRGGSA